MYQVTTLNPFVSILTYSLKTKQIFTNGKSRYVPSSQEKITTKQNKTKTKQKQKQKKYTTKHVNKQN